RRTSFLGAGSTSFSDSFRINYGVANEVAVNQGMQREMPIVDCTQSRSVTDRYYGYTRKLLLDNLIQSRLRSLVKRRGGFIQQEKIRRLQNCTRDAETLLFAKRQYLIPMRFLGMTFRERGQPD